MSYSHDEDVNYAVCAVLRLWHFLWRSRSPVPVLHSNRRNVLEQHVLSCR